MKIAILVINNITFIYVVAKKDKTCTFFREITHINKTIFFVKLQMNFDLPQEDVMVTHLVLQFMSIASATYDYQRAVKPKGKLST